MNPRVALLASIMTLGGLSAFWLIPRTMAAKPSVDIAAMVPAAFGHWHLVPNVRLVTVQDPNSLERELYSQVVTRAYVDEDRHMVMLLLAYGPTQTDRLQLHRPEICYVANGFRVGRLTSSIIDVGGTRSIPVRRLIATREDRVEYVSYWMRIGDTIANSVFRRQLIKLGYGLKGIIPDGLLVRTSVVGSSQAAYALQDQFINALTDHASAPLRAQLFGRSPIETAAASP